MTQADRKTNTVVVDRSGLHCGADPTSGIARLPEVVQATGLSRSTLYRMSAAGRFPSRLKVGLRAVGWSREAVLKWCAERPSATANKAA